MLGYLNSKSVNYSVVVANPTYKPDGSFGHTEWVLRYAEKEDIRGHWNFKPQGLYLPQAKTDRGHSLLEKRATANELAEIIVISPGLPLQDGKVLVYDDVCTTGYQLDAIARVLKMAGAASVTGLVLARTPLR